MGKDKWAEVIEYLRTSNRDPKKTLKLLKGNEKGHQSNYNINRSSYTLNVIAAITQKILDPKNKNKNITSIIRSWVITKDFEEFYTDDEDLDMNKFSSIGIIKNDAQFDSEKLSYFLRVIEEIKLSQRWSRNDLVELFHSVISNFGHKETGKFLDNRM